MPKVRCENCQHILGEKTGNGELVVRQECHKDLVISGCNLVKCPDCGYQNVVWEKKYVN